MSRTRSLVLSAALAVLAVPCVPALAGVASAANSTVLSLAATSAVTSPQPATLTGRLVRSGGIGLSGRPVVLQSRPHGTATWTRLASVTTGSNGTFRAQPHPSRNTDYRAVFAGSSIFARSASVSRAVGVRSAVRVTTDVDLVDQGGDIEVQVTVTPAAPGQQVVIEQQAGTAPWTRAAVGVLDATGSALVSVTAADVGSLRLRALRPAGSATLSGVSAALTLEVLDPLPVDVPLPPDAGDPGLSVDLPVGLPVDLTDPPAVPAADPAVDPAGSSQPGSATAPTAEPTADPALTPAVDAPAAGEPIGAPPGL